MEATATPSPTPEKRLITYQKPVEGHKQRGITRRTKTTDISLVTDKSIRDIWYSLRKQGQIDVTDGRIIDLAIAHYQKLLLENGFPLVEMPAELVEARKVRAKRTFEGMSSRKEKEANVKPSKPSWAHLVES